MPMFNTYLMVDWSAAASPASWPPGADSIWWAAVQDRSTRVRRKGKSEKRFIPPAESIVAHERTRSSALEHITDFLRNEVRANRRVLIGLDFAFGYPSGFLTHLASQKVVPKAVLPKAEAPCLWKWCATREELENRPTNANDRFVVAGELNATYGRAPSRPGPFYLNRKNVIPKGASGVQKRRPEPWPEHLPAQHRRTDLEIGGRSASSVWKLMGQDSVGSQVLMGLRALHELRSTFSKRMVVWPFCKGFQCPATDQPDQQIVIVEIYPSLLDRYISLHKEDHEIKDRAQVRLSARAFARLDREHHDLFRALFGRPEVSVDDWTRVADEEGWIFGAGAAEKIHKALT